MNYTSTLGTTTEVECLLAFLKLGYSCSIPYGNLARYDFIVDIDNKLYKIQCKNSHCIKGVEDNPEGFIFNTSRINIKTGETIRYKYKEEEIDYFATYFSGKVYVFPISECLGSTKTVRLKPPKNNIGKEHYTNADNYEISKIFTPSKELVSSRREFKKRSTIKEKTKNYCPICGKEVTKKGNLCVDCARKKARKVNWPEKETLETLISTNSILTISRMFSVSDNTVRRWCKHYGLITKRTNKTLDN